MQSFQSIYAEALTEGMERKLGLTPGADGNGKLIERLWALLEQSRADFTLFFRRLTQVAAGADDGSFMLPFNEAREEASRPSSRDWRGLTAGAERVLPPCTASNPIVIARNHRVEQALAAATTGDLEPLRRLGAALKNPFEEPGPDSDLEAPPMPEEIVHETFCGT